jgi:hypothetical protein
MGGLCVTGGDGRSKALLSSFSSSFSLPDHEVNRFFLPHTPVIIF